MKKKLFQTKNVELIHNATFLQIFSVACLMEDSWSWGQHAIGANVMAVSAEIHEDTAPSGCEAGWPQLPWVQVMWGTEPRASHMADQSCATPACLLGSRVETNELAYPKMFLRDLLTMCTHKMFSRDLLIALQGQLGSNL